MIALVPGIMSSGFPIERNRVARRATDAGVQRRTLIGGPDFPKVPRRPPIDDTGTWTPPAETPPAWSASA